MTETVDDRQPPMTMVFTADTAANARAAASLWLTDFTKHPPLDIRLVQVDQKEGGFLATVYYFLLPSSDEDGPNGP